VPIPKTLTPKKLRSQFAADTGEDDEACDTQGTAYLLSGPSPASMMRHWRIGSIMPMPGLDPEILALYGPGDPAQLEETSHEAAGGQYEARGDADVMALMCKAVREEATKQAAQATAKAGGRGAQRLPDRIRTVLAGVEDALTADEVFALVLADGGPEVKIGSVRNALGQLADEGDVARAGRGLYEIAR
jgi:hypothetical protein